MTIKLFSLKMCTTKQNKAIDSNVKAMKHYLNLIKQNVYHQYMMPVYFLPLFSSFLLEIHTHTHTHTHTTFMDCHVPGSLLALLM